MRSGGFFSVVLWIFSLPVLAQYGNEWIQFNQPYFKIPVAADGLYRITRGDLQAAGFPVGSDPRRFQLFHRGVEQAIYVQGEADAVFDPGDYVEFYGRRNDGTLDTAMYKPASAQPHPYYNLYSDTSAYFLTVNPLVVAGKRMTLFSEVNSGGLPAQTSHNRDRMLVIADQFSPGTVVNDYVYNSWYDFGEGWTGVELRQAESASYTLDSIVNPVTADGTPLLELLLVGRYTLQHHADIYAGPNASSLRLLTGVDFADFNTTLVQQSLNWSDVGADGKLAVRVDATGVGGASDRLSASYIRVTFPQSFDGAGIKQRTLHLKPNAGGKSFLKITNPPAGLRLFDITNPSSVRRIGVTAGTTVDAVVDNMTNGRVLRAVSQVLSPAPIQKVTFRQIDPAQHDYVIISHHSLMQPAGGYPDAVRAYAGYRSSAAGGSYDTLVVDVDQLYDQFAYGEITPLAIIHFMKFLADSNVPRYLFIIGKSLDVGYRYHRNPSAYSTYRDLVPSMGWPPSDVYFTAGLAGSGYEGAVPTGRLSAMTPLQVISYLNKVKEMEALPYQNAWRKNLLHLSGGINAGEPQRFKGYLESYGNIAGGYYLGGNVKAIAKQNTGIDFINIKDEVNAGLNLVTFFGHSSPSTIDFDIGFVTDPQLGYANKGKYPVMLMNGCNIGSFFLNTTVFGEDWINAADKGAVGFIAHSSYGLEFSLRFYSQLFYQVGYADPAFIKMGLGDIKKEVGRRYLDLAPATTQNISQVEQMVLLGDPAVRLFGATKPDYAIEGQHLYIESFDDNPVTALSDSMALRVVVNNYGISDMDSITIRVTRRLENGTTFSHDMQYAPVLNTDTVTFTVHRESADAYGINTFEVLIDPLDSVSELREDNNAASLEYFVPLSRTKALFPSGSSIVSSTTPTLSFQSTDLLSGERVFEIELDTTDTFDSPWLQQLQDTSRVLGSVQVSLLNNDSTAYYWRVRYAAPGTGESGDWAMSSFSYINGSPPGWGQLHFPQYRVNQFEGLVADTVQRMFTLKETVTSVVIRTYGAANPALNTDVSVKLNDAEYNLSTQNQPCRDNTINLMAFDKTTTVPYYGGLPFNFQDPRSCGREPQIIVSFTTSEVETGNGDDLIQYIDNVATGDSVVLFSIGDAGYSVWSATVISKLGEIGISAAQVSALTDGEPVVMLAKKGTPAGSAVVYQASGSPATDQQLDVSTTITGRYTSGQMLSVRIGPALAWNDFYEHSTVSEATDDYSYDLYGVRLDGEREALMTGVTGPQALSGVDADSYPYVDLVYTAADTINLTAPQLRHWIVTYAPAAEGLLVFAGDTAVQVLQEGEGWSGRYGFVNISNASFADSLAVAVTVFNNDDKAIYRDTMQILEPVTGDTTWFDVNVGTRGKTGWNDLSVFVNPRVQPEQYFDNNILALGRYLHVLRDETDPVLDVTIDGRHLLNNDYVTPNPEIMVTVWDENPFLLRNDTVGVRLFLKRPCEGCDFEPIYFSRSDVTWFPATADEPFRVEFRPANLAEGEYEFRADATDVSGNASGDEPYDITFRVRYDLTVTLVPPYPNPSSRGFHFDLLITGDTRPDYVDVEIITLTGMLVNKFSTEDLHVGTNRLEWDGRDLWGKALDAGMYIYKVKVFRQGHPLLLMGVDGGRLTGAGRVVVGK